MQHMIPDYPLGHTPVAWGLGYDLVEALWPPQEALPEDP